MTAFTVADHLADRRRMVKPIALIQRRAAGRRGSSGKAASRAPMARKLVPRQATFALSVSLRDTRDDRRQTFAQLRARWDESP